jgi:hypothetical protein
MNRFLRAPSLLSLLVLAGCAGSSTMMIGDARPALDPAAVQVFYARPPGAVDIAELDARSGVGFGTTGQRKAAIERMRRDAAALGANGVLLLGGGSGRGPVDVGVGAGTSNYDHNSGSSVGVGFNIPTEQVYVHGLAIWVPAEE